MKRATNRDEVHVVRYADDFIISSSSRVLLENEVKFAREQWTEVLKVTGYRTSMDGRPLARNIVVGRCQPK